MNIFKNDVGRPSKETLKKRKIIKITGLVVCLTLIFALLLRLNVLTKLKGDVTPNPAFTDQNFYCAVVQAYNNQFSASYDCNSDSLTDEELTQITNLNYSYHTLSNTNGLEKLVGLTYLNLSNNGLNEIDLNNLTNLTNLVLSDNNISEIDVSNLTNLTYLYLSYNNLSKMDVSNLTSLLRLDLSNNNLSEIIFNNNNNIESLDLYNNNISEIDVSSLTNLTELNLFNNNLSEIDVSNLTNLTYLYLFNNNLSEIDLSKNTNLRDLHLENNNITELDISNNTNLDGLSLDLDLYSKVDYSNLTASEVLFSNSFVMLPDDEIDLTEVINFFDNKFNISRINLNSEVTSYNDGKVTAIKEGFNYEGVVVMENGYRYEPLIIVIDKIKSDVYDIDYKEKYIYVGEDTDEKIKENITMGNNFFVNMCNSEEDFDSCMEEMEMDVFYKIDKNILKSIYSGEGSYYEMNYQLGRIDLSGFDVEDKVINIDSEEFDINTISVDNVKLEYKNGKLLVYNLNDELLDEYTVKLKDKSNNDVVQTTKSTLEITKTIDKNPITYDNIMNYFIIGGISIILLILGIIIYVKKKK